MVDDARPRHMVRVLEVFTEARLFDLPSHLALDDLHTDVTTAYQQASVYEFLYGPPHRRPGQAESLGDGHLVLEASACRDSAGMDRCLEPTGAASIAAASSRNARCIARSPQVRGCPVYRRAAHVVASRR